MCIRDSKDAVAEALTWNMPANARKVLELKQVLGKTSPAKYESFHAGVSPDGNYRGAFLYHGCGTGRDSGKRVQPQNFPRGSMSISDIDRALEDLKGGMGWEDVDTFYGDPLDVAASCLRGVICAPEGKDLICSDYSAVEGRGLAWLAGEDSVLADYIAGRDPYLVAAMPLFDKTYEELAAGMAAKEKWAKDARQAGKPSDLGFGYGGGIGAYETFSTAYGLDVSHIYNLLRDKFDPEETDKCRFLAERYLRMHPDTKFRLEEAIGADMAKRLWRESHPYTVLYWKALDEAAHSAVMHPGEVFPVRNVAYLCADNFLYCRLPSGRVLHYYDPKIKIQEDEDFGEREAVTYMRIDSATNKWRRTFTYGGKLAENVTQAVCRDLLFFGALKLESAGYPIVSRIHDELVACVPEGFGSIEEFESLMATLPKWAAGFPLTAAGGWRGKRYRKD